MAIWTEYDIRVGYVRSFYWAIAKSIFTKTYYFLEYLIRGVLNPPLYGVRLDGLLNLLFGGTCKVLANRLNHADSFFVLAQINVCHPLAYSCIPLEDIFLALWVGYNPVSLCVGAYNVPRVFNNRNGQ